MPFIALPYIISRLGAQNYGLYVFFYTISGYFLLLIAFGLDSMLVKDISVARDKPEVLNKIVSTAFGAKLLIAGLIFVVSGIAALFIPFLYENKLIFFYSLLFSSSSIFISSWFFQGIEDMKYMTLIRGATVLLYTVSIFIFIKDESDSPTLMLLQTISKLMAAFVSMYLLIKIGKIRFHIPFLCDIKEYLKKSYPLFIANAFLGLNATIGKMFCGLFSLEAMAAFDLAQKIAVTSLTPVRMLDSAAFPHIAKTKNKKFINVLFFVNLGIALAISTSIYFLAPYIIHIFAENSLPQSVPILKILSLLTFFGCIATYTGVPLLVSFGHNHSLNFTVLFSFASMFVMYVTCYSIQVWSIYVFAVIFVLTELMLASSRIFFCVKYKILFSA